MAQEFAIGIFCEEKAASFVAVKKLSKPHSEDPHVWIKWDKNTAYSFHLFGYATTQRSFT